MSRKRSEDWEDLVAAAKQAISKALADGETVDGHYAGEWLTESVPHQIEHADAHFTAFQFGGNLQDLEHLICRFTMAYALAKGAKL